MVKRLIWMILLVLGTAFSFVSGDINGVLDIFYPSQTAVIPTEVVLTSTPGSTFESPTATLEPVDELTPTAVLTEEPTATAAPIDTITPTPTATLAPTATEIPLPTATQTPLPTATPTTVPFQVQAMTPIFMSNFVHTDAACNWQGVAGQAFEANDVPVLNYIVKITGLYNGQMVNLLGVTGMVSGLPYGPGSYEIVLGSTPVDSLDTLSIQLFNENGDPITDPLSFSTSKDCSKNLVIINFKHK